MRQPNHALILYPVIGLLSLAACVPLLNSSLVTGPSPAELNAPAPPKPKIVVSSSQPRAQTDTQPESPTATARATPATVAATGGDERWWRAQLDRLGTMSVVHLPNPPPKPAPAPVLDRAQREAAQRDAAALAAARAPPAPPAPPRAAAPPVADGRLSERVPAAIRRWEPLIVRAARKHELDPSLIAALMQTESGGNPNAVSPMNAVGLLQVLNGPFDPEANIDQGAGMLAANLKRFGNLNLALAAYNAGPNAVARYGGIPPYEETHNHVTRTLASYAAFRG